MQKMEIQRKPTATKHNVAALKKATKYKTEHIWNELGS